MAGRPGKLQAGFSAGEIDPLLHQRTTLKYFSTGTKRMENVVVMPQGGFRLRGGMKDIGAVNAAATRLFPFNASDGSVYDLSFAAGEFEAWGETSKLDTVTVSAVTAPILAEMTVAQQLDTMLLFHNDLKSTRIKHAGPTDWSTDDVPFENIFNYDYGGPIGGGDYTNGVPAEWELEFVGLTSGESVFVITVSGQDAVSLTYSATATDLAALIETAILDLPNVAAGLTVVSSSGGAGGKKVTITFSGEDNTGDGWAVSGRVINKTDAAILAFKRVPGIAPGEPVFSADRGWPHCGTFYAQRLLIGGFKGLPNAWAFSVVGDYYNFDTRFTEANGPALVPMDVPGGERVERLVAGRNLQVFTTGAEYWLAERKLSATEAPNHVQSSANGTARGLPIVENEGASLHIRPDRGVLGEHRYTDVEGNYVSLDISLLAAHLIKDVRDIAIKRAKASTDGNTLAVVNDDGNARLATLLREQEVTAFARMTTDGDIKAVCRNGRNELTWLTERTAGRRIERLNDDYLLDQARDFSFGSPASQITGLADFNGQSVWVVADNDVFGPYTVSGGVIDLPISVTAGYVGTWSPPVVTTLPPARDIGPNVVLTRKARIHTVHISVQDTTSLAISVNDKPLKNINLVRYGAPADVAELDAAVTGLITVRGLTGWRDEPTVTIGQTRPGKLTVRSVTVEAAL